MAEKQATQKYSIVAIGEVLWDLLPTGRQMGGAPTNFVCHARALGTDARLVSRVGADDLGREILQRLQSMGIPVDTVGVDPLFPTGTVGVDLAADGQPRFTIHTNTAWDAIVLDDSARRLAKQADAVCFGTLAQRSPVSRASIQQWVQEVQSSAIRVFDINLRQHFHSPEVIETSLKLANVLKLNDTELPVLEKQLGLKGRVEEQLQQIAERYGLRCVALTRGAQGSLLWREGTISEHPGVRTVVKDTVGAGDSFTAVLTVGLLAHWDSAVIQERANRVAAFVASCDGATPPLPQEFRSFLSS